MEFIEKHQVKEFLTPLTPEQMEEHIFVGRKCSCFGPSGVQISEIRPSGVQIRQKPSKRSANHEIRPSGVQIRQKASKWSANPSKSVQAN